jgi:predicted nucleic acid-binding protein
MASQLTLLDTSAWIEWLAGSAVGEKLGQVFPAQSQCLVPTMVQLELAKWLTREKDEETADRVLAYTQKCMVIPLDTHLALLAGQLHQTHKLATADAIVYATAQRHNAELLTCGPFRRAGSGSVVGEKTRTQLSCSQSPRHRSIPTTGAKYQHP